MEDATIEVEQIGRFASDENCPAPRFGFRPSMPKTSLDPFQPALALAPATPIAAPAEAERLRVLHVVNGEHFSGAERVQSHLGRCLPDFGVRADFACLKPGRFADAVDASQGRWGEAIRVKMRNRFDLSVARLLSRHVRDGGYRLLHAHTPRAAMVTSITSRLSGVPWVYHVHSPATSDSSRRWNNWLNAQVEAWSLKSCSHLITVSESLRKACLAAGHAASHVTVVHNGVPGIRYRRAEYPLPGGPWTFGMIALMRPRKGLEIALQAIAQLRQDGFDASLRCIGPFESVAYRQSIERLIDRLGIASAIQMDGFQENIGLTLSQIDGLLLPSLYGEGLPMVVLEAMASALPVIATRVEGTPEAIRDGIEGLLAQPGSVESLADRMIELMTGRFDWSLLAERAARRHATAFSDVAMARGVSQVYDRVMGTSDSPTGDYRIDDSTAEAIRVESNEKGNGVPSL